MQEAQEHVLSAILGLKVFPSTLSCSTQLDYLKNEDVGLSTVAEHTFDPKWREAPHGEVLIKLARLGRRALRAVGPVRTPIDRWESKSKNEEIENPRPVSFALMNGSATTFLHATSAKQKRSHEQTEGCLVLLNQRCRAMPWS